MKLVSKVALLVGIPVMYVATTVNLSNFCAIRENIEFKGYTKTQAEIKVKKEFDGAGTFGARPRLITVTSRFS